MEHHHDRHMGHEHYAEPLESPREYVKFTLVILGIVIASIIIATAVGWSLRQFMNSFMGSFLLVFGAFKLINIEMFSITYRGYDLIARRFPVWGYILPFVELFLGMSYLVSSGPMWLNLLTLLITGSGTVGVYKELTRTARQRKIMCACLGTVIRLPLSKVSLVEDVLMFVMAVIMLIL